MKRTRFYQTIPFMSIIVWNLFCIYSSLSGTTSLNDVYREFLPRRFAENKVFIKRDARILYRPIQLNAQVGIYLVLVYL
ncbi:MAG: hypothetical protein ACFFAS_17955 [Promethearchaeota archaeon]